MVALLCFTSLYLLYMADEAAAFSERIERTAVRHRTLQQQQQPTPPENAVPTAAPVIVEYWTDPPTSAPVIVEYWTDPPPTYAPTIIEYWPVPNQPEGPPQPSVLPPFTNEQSEPPPPTSAPVIVDYWPVPNQPEGPDPNIPASNNAAASKDEKADGSVAIRTGANKDETDSNSFRKNGPGIAIICLLVILLVLFVAYCCCRLRQKATTTKTSRSSQLLHPEQKTILDTTECSESSSCE